jgi:sulfur-oxidizing protein SoxZ
MARTLITIPESARAGEAIAIRTLIQHPMESGHRVGAEGRVVPRDIIRRFSCRYNGETVFSADLFAAIAANPLIEFSTLAIDSGSLEFSWEGDNGFTHRESVGLKVMP